MFLEYSSGGNSDPFIQAINKLKVLRDNLERTGDVFENILDTEISPLYNKFNAVVDLIEALLDKMVSRNHWITNKTMRV